MSTMYDALKKAEAERNKTAGPAEKTRQTPTIGGMLEMAKAVALLIAVIVVFVIAFYRIKGGMQAPVKPTGAVQTAGTGKASGAIAPGQTQPPAYSLDGVIEAGKDSMAIINGKFLKLEGNIDALILKKISPKEVELLNTKNNSMVVLKIE